MTFDGDSIPASHVFEAMCSQTQEWPEHVVPGMGEATYADALANLVCAAVPFIEPWDDRDRRRRTDIDRLEAWKRRTRWKRPSRAKRRAA